jgi:hypothetical protein
LASHPDLVVAAIHQLVSDELTAAKEAAAFLVKYAKTDSGKEFLLSETGIAAIKAELSDTSVVEWKKLRIYENLVEISTISPEHFFKLNESINLMPKLIGLTFDSNDPLGQMNALEILSNLVGSPHGHMALQGAGVFEKVVQIGQDWRNTPMGSLIIPGVVKFIGKIGAVQLPPEELTLIALNVASESGKDYALITVGMEAIGYIGTTLEGKKYLKARHGTCNPAKQVKLLSRLLR